MRFNITPQTGKRISIMVQEGTNIVAQLELPINPEQLERSAPARVTVTQTAGGYYEEHYGPGIVHGTISGHTGWRGRQRFGDPTQPDGRAVFMTFYRDIYQRYNQLKATARDPESVKMLLVNQIDDECYIIVPEDFRTRRSKQSPLLYYYEMPFHAVEDMMAGAAKPLEDPLINRFVSATGKEQRMKQLSQLVAGQFAELESEMVN